MWLQMKQIGILEQHMFLVLELQDTLTTYMDKRRIVLKVKGLYVNIQCICGRKVKGHHRDIHTLTVAGCVSITAVPVRLQACPEAAD